MNTRLYLRTMLILSWLSLALGVALPVIGRITGDPAPTWFIVYFMIGVIGTMLHQALDRMEKRIAALEGEE